MKTDTPNQSAISAQASDSGSGMLIGRVISINDNGNPLIAYDAQSQQQPVEALTTVPIDTQAIGKDVAVSFAQNQNAMPIVMGIIRRLIDDVIAAPINTDKPEHGSQSNLGESADEVVVDGRKLVLSAADEITIRCGEASITLTREGKILLKGDHMLNRLSGSYKIKSGSIDLN